MFVQEPFVFIKNNVEPILMLIFNRKLKMCSIHNNDLQR